MDSHNPKSTPSKPVPGLPGMTGCVEGQDGQYGLVDDRGLELIAGLQAEGFPPEGFARRVGHEVTRGAGGTRPVFTVRGIETVSDTCAPAARQ
jgi:hypothetical protein